MNTMIKLIRNSGIKWKFVAVNLLILAISLAASGIYLYKQTSASAIKQSQIVLEQNLLQTRSGILDKVKRIENTSKLFVTDIRVQTFLGSDFLDTAYHYEDYKSTIIPFADNVMMQDPFIHSFRVYMLNPSIPEVYDTFYQATRLKDQNWMLEQMDAQDQASGWSDLHDTAVVIPKIDQAESHEDVISYYQKIKSFRYDDIVGFLEIEIKERDLFDAANMNLSAIEGDVFILNANGEVVSSNVPELYKQKLTSSKLLELPVNQKVNQVMKIEGNHSIVISAPLEGLHLQLIGVFPVSALNAGLKQSALSIAGVMVLFLIVLGIIIYLITNALLSRLKILVRAMKQVRGGSLAVTVPVTGNDEFTQIAITFNHMTKRIHDLIETVYKIQLMEREAELRALESQVNPHFLYNTLATISWVARKAKSQEIVQLSGSLGQFYRLVLNKGKREILMMKELEMVKAYLDIQKFRFEGLFDVVYEIDETVYEYCVVKNILQPIVENALTHGIEPKRSHGTIIIKAGIEQEMLFFTVIDDGVGMDKTRMRELLEGRIEKSSGSGYAVRNIMERLQSYYGNHHVFLIHSAPGIGTTVTVQFPKERGE